MGRPGGRGRLRRPRKIGERRESFRPLSGGTDEKARHTVADVIELTTTEGEIELKPGKSTTIRYTAKNTSHAREHIQVAPMPASQNQWGNDPLQRWLSVKGDNEADLPGGETETFDVELKVPPDAEPGAYGFRLNAYRADTPDERIGEGQAKKVNLQKTDNGGGFNWIPIIIAAAAVVVIGIGLGLFFALRGGGVAVPDVLALDQDAAIAALEDAGLEAKIEGEPQAQGAVVLLQEPDHNEKAGKGSEVTLTMGAPTLSMPDLGGMRLQDAEAKLTEAGLVVGFVEPVKENPNEAGNILRQTPAAGEEVPLGTQVTLVMEARLVSVPDVIGQSNADAGATLTNLNLKVQPEAVQTQEAQPGTVLDQDPEQGTLVQEGHVVKLKVVAARFSVPDMKGKSADEAERLLKQDGWKVTQSPKAVLGMTKGQVIDQSPGANAQVLSKETVTLFTVGDALAMPDVIKTTEAQAVEALKAKGLIVKVAKGKSDLVQTTNPAPGTPVLKGSTVTINMNPPSLIFERLRAKSLVPREAIRPSK
jgi:beta-lactam-binding protein with PASTA domain